MIDEQKTKEQLLSELQQLRRQLASREVRPGGGVNDFREADSERCADRYLVDEKYGIRDLVDIEALRRVFSAFSETTGFTAGLVEFPMQRVLIGTGWRDICAKFHWACPDSLRQCKKSNALLTEKLREHQRLSINECENGLMEGATPIIIKGKHIASITTGQVFFRRPHIEYFRNQADRFGFDPDSYLDALGKVPVVPEGQFRNALSFLCQLAMMIVELGMSNLEIRETLSRLEDEIHDRKQAQKALQVSRNELRHLSSQLLIAQEEERKRIAGELHDGLGSYLTAIRFALETARKQLARGKADPVCLDSPISEMERLIQEVRRIWMDLRPSVLDSFGLVAALEWFIKQYGMNCPGISIDGRFDIEEKDVTEDLKIVVFRIVQEAFNNIAKHSGSDRVELRLARNDKLIELLIADNGAGFPREEVVSGETRKGIGLTSMRERAKLSGGNLTIESAPGCGTKIFVCWPLG
ncbi:MAG: PocR ligand-binding domain-containing protein [Syntrophobacter sp.]